MAKLGDFLGGLVSSISNARVNSDLQSLKIAEEYAKNNLLQHFAVPRMRVDEVELNIPVAIDKFIEKIAKVYEPIDNKSFLSITYRQILKCLAVSKLSKEVSKTLRTYIAKHIQLLEAEIRVYQNENALEEFSKCIALKVIELKNIIFKEANRKQLSKDELSKLQDSIRNKLQASLKDEIKYKSQREVLYSLQVIVEADKLHEVRPDNIINIKMTVSEHGMEWIKMENNKGEVVTKLMPE